MFRIISSSIIINKKGQLLILRRSSKSKHYINYWQLPEGKVEDGETPDFAMVRELEEELGMQAKKISLKSVIPVKITLDGVEYVIIRLVYNAQMNGEIELSKDHDRIKWVHVGEALKLDLVPGTTEVIKWYTEQL